MLTVTSASTDDRLCTLSRLKHELEITTDTDDDILDSCIREASDFAVTFTGRKFVKERVTETLGSIGRPLMLLTRRPVVSIVSVSQDGTTISSTQYSIELDGAGGVWREVGWDSTELLHQFVQSHPTGYTKKDWSFDYRGGYVLPTTSTASTETRTLPRDLERSALILSKQFWFDRDTNPEVVRQRIGDAWESRYDKEPGIAPAAARILERWRSIDL